MNWISVWCSPLGYEIGAETENDPDHLDYGIGAVDWETESDPDHLDYEIGAADWETDHDLGYPRGHLSHSLHGVEKMIGSLGQYYWQV